MCISVLRLCACVCVYMCVDVCVCVWMCVYVYVCVDVCVYVYVWMCVYVYVCVDVVNTTMCLVHSSSPDKCCLTICTASCKTRVVRLAPEDTTYLFNAHFIVPLHVSSHPTLLRVTSWTRTSWAFVWATSRGCSLQALWPSGESLFQFRFYQSPFPRCLFIPRGAYDTTQPYSNAYEDALELMVSSF